MSLYFFNIFRKKILSISETKKIMDKDIVKKNVWISAVVFFIYDVGFGEKNTLKYS